MNQPIFTATRLLGKYVDPVLKPAGFQRRGKTFFKPNLSGDQQFVDFQLVTSFKPFVTLRVTVGTDLQISRDVFNHECKRIPAGPPIGLPLWDCRVYPERAGLQGDWVYNGQDPVEAAFVGEALAQAIHEDALPLVDHLSDVGRLEGELRGCERRWELAGKLYFGKPRGRPLAMVIASQRQDPEVDDIVIAEIESVVADDFERTAVGYLPSLIERLSSGDYPHRSRVLRDLWNKKAQQGGQEWALPE